MKLIMTGEPGGGARRIEFEAEHDDGLVCRVGGANYDEHGWGGLAAVQEMGLAIAREFGIEIVDRTT